MKQKFDIIQSTCVPLPLENVDTDQIIPARFLKATTRDEKFFGENLFRDWRYDKEGNPKPDFVLNDPTYSGEILVAGKNFGSGSSREHAAWAIAGYGFRVVISSFFADIHKNNELNNFVLPVVVSEQFLAELFASIKNDPKTQVKVDVPNQTVTNLATGKSERFDINGYKKYCLMNALDDIDFLLENKDKIEVLEKELLLLMAPGDPRDNRSVIMEIRAGAGGEEAALFADTLFKMYKGYCMRKGFDTEIIDLNATDLGGIKEIVFEIKGKGAYSKFKFESGVHRVQRVPVTESGGRIHTSTATVAVLPEAEATDVVINPDDLRIDRYRASGAGGQHVNRTDSAIRITHIPTGLVVQCQDERSQYKNKDKAMAVLQSRLWELANSSAKDKEDSERRSQVGTGDRSERIRTYNYHQGRVSDHRIGLTLYKLEEILAGDLDEIINSLTVAAASDSLGQASDED